MVFIIHKTEGCRVILKKQFFPWSYQSKVSRNFIDNWTHFLLLSQTRKIAKKKLSWPLFSLVQNNLTISLTNYYYNIIPFTWKRMTFYKFEDVLVGRNMKNPDNTRKYQRIFIKQNSSNNDSVLILSVKMLYSALKIIKILL